MDPVVAALAAERSAGLTVAAAPIPHGHWARRQPAEQVRCVGFFGHQREERGLSALGPLVRELLARGLQVLLHDTRGGVLPPEPGLEMVPGFVDDLGALMARCDLVLCPMDTDRYRQRLSGTATSAIASGVPVVLPAGTLTAQLWRDAGSVLSYEGDSMQDLLRCVDQVRANAAHFARQAQTAAQEWQRCHGLERFIDRVLAPA
jgi:glycosyltransferase involved in cell wall biosynthesis